MATFNSYVKLPEGSIWEDIQYQRIHSIMGIG